MLPAKERRMMETYHKIDTIFLRDPATKFRTVIEGQYTRPEFEYLAHNQWLWTEKIDGTNIRIQRQNGVLEFGGRTSDSSIPTFLLRKLQGLFNVVTLGVVFGDGDFELYAEGYGAKIQKIGEKYLPNDCGVILFDVRINGVWLERYNVADIAEKLRIPVVPQIQCGTLLDAIEYVRQGFNSFIGDLPGEGLVLKPACELLDRLGKRIITKIKHRDFQR